MRSPKALPARNVTILAVVAAYAATTWWRHRAEAERIGTDGSAVARFLSVFAAAWMALALGWGAWATLLWPFWFSPLRHLPQPTGNAFLLGQFGRIFREPTGVPAREWINTIPNRGLIRYLSLFHRERLLVTSPAALAEVLVAKNYDFVKPADVREFLGRILGVGVLLAEGDEHRFQRRQLLPAFAFRHVKNLYPVFWRKGRESAATMRREMADAETDSPAIEIGECASRVTLDIIGLAGLGRDFGALQDPDNELASTYRSLFKPSKQARFFGLVSLLPPFLVSALPLARRGQLVEAGSYLRSLCRDLVQEKKGRLAKRAADTTADTTADIDILSVALESGGFTDANLADQLMTFLAAGHETTATAMTWAIYLLCCHPDVQARLRAEIRAHLPPLGDDGSDDHDDHSDVTSVDIDHLPYLHAVCSEVLRYFAPVPETMRDAAVDTSIQGQFVPRGTQIMIVPWAINRSQALWGDDALQFRPERWLSEEGKSSSSSSSGGGGSSGSSGSVSNYAFLTFLHGPRSCIGMGFARAEFACLLAAWVGRFDFRLRDPADADEANLCIRGTVTAWPAHGLYVHATPLQGW